MPDLRIHLQSTRLLYWRCHCVWVATINYNARRIPLRRSYLDTPVIHRKQCKVELLILMVHSSHRPLYLRECVASVSSDPGRQRRRSATAVLTMRFHRPEHSLETELSLLPVIKFETVCRSLTGAQTLPIALFAD